MNISRKIGVMVIDDHPLMRVGIGAIINARKDMSVVAQAGTGEEALELYRRHQPDIVLMDLRLPGGMSGVEAIRAIRSIEPSARFIVVTTYDGDEDIHRALEAGAQGYVIKGMPYQTLVDALLRVHSGGRFLPPPVARALASRGLRERIAQTNRSAPECLRRSARRRFGREARTRAASRTANA